ncbi:MAG: MTAP family purine nucleoside phosphorylase [Bdellovibrionales bacterium]|nr:MTAP family purine nucleoside phosphorylase [Bdellovibrionales bacterium]
MWGIIGGSGFEKFDGFEVIEELKRSTPFGDCSEGLKIGKVGGEKVVFLPRHGLHHTQTPSEVNYRANIYALKKCGVRQILAFSAVGSLRNELVPGDMVVPHQYIDRTKSLRKASFCGEGMVAHVSLANPTSQILTDQVKIIAKEMSFKCHFDRVSIVVEGPYFSTKAESHMYRALGADIIGMTAFPEYALAREAGMAFLPCSFVTDYDCWKDDIPHVTVQEVMNTMKLNNGKAFTIAERIVKIDSAILKKASELENGLKNGLMTPMAALSPAQQEWMSVLTT